MVYYGRSMDIEHHPELIQASAFVAPNATVIGDVRVGALASIWFGCVLRGDDAPIIIGARTNIQDLTVVHADTGQPCVLGEGVSVGHRVVLHSAVVEDGALIGIGAIVLNGATIGCEALVGAGALVPEGMSVPPRHLALGLPARVVRELTPDELALLRAVAVHYVARRGLFLNARKGA